MLLLASTTQQPYVQPQHYAPPSYPMAPMPMMAPSFIPAQPQYFQQQNWWGSSTVRTVSDVESYMVNKKLKDIPPFKPYQNGQQPVYAENRADWDFLMRAIVHRDQLDPIIKELDLKRDSEKNILMIKAVQDMIAPQLQQMTSIAAPYAIRSSADAHAVKTFSEICTPSKLQRSSSLVVQTKFKSFRRNYF